MGKLRDRHHRLPLVVLLTALAALGLGACGGSTRAAVPTTTTSTTSVSTTTAPPTTPPSSAAPTTSSSTAPPTTSVVGLTLTGAGNSFTAPASPTTKPYNQNCQSLIDPGFTGSCLIVTGSAGTAAGVVERQDGDYQSGQPIVNGQERDLVYVEVNGDWSLRLRRTPAASGQAITLVSGSDIMRDGDAKLIFVQPAPNSQFGNELDVVEETGAVSLYRQLHGGFATVAPAGGLTTYVPSAAGYDSAVIDYAHGAWRITSTGPVSQTQAQAEGDQPFSDPMGIQASY